MSTYAALPFTPPSISFAGARYSPRTALPLSMGGAVTTYYYITTVGTRGSTTSIGSIPAGAVVMMVT